MSANSKGMRKIADMVGEEALKANYANLCSFDQGLADIIVNTCFGDVWCRPGLSAKQRSMITIAALVATGPNDELKGHLKMGLNNGVTKEELREIIVHISQYAGIPAAMNAIKLYQEVVA